MHAFESNYPTEILCMDDYILVNLRQNAHCPLPHLYLDISRFTQQINTWKIQILLARSGDDLGYFVGTAWGTKLRD